VSECDGEASIKRKPWSARGCFVMGGKTKLYPRIYLTLEEKNQQSSLVI
jgi:hypothetical protein